MIEFMKFKTGLGYYWIRVGMYAINYVNVSLIVN